MFYSNSDSGILTCVSNYNIDFVSSTGYCARTVSVGNKRLKVHWYEVRLLDKKKKVVIKCVVDIKTGGNRTENVPNSSTVARPHSRPVAIYYNQYKQHFLSTRKCSKFRGYFLRSTPYRVLLIKVIYGQTMLT